MSNVMDDTDSDLDFNNLVQKQSQKTNKINQRKLDNFGKTTTWINDTKYTVKFRLLTDKTTGRFNSGGLFVNIVIPPGEKKVLPVDYDQAIRDVDQFGVIVGGLCPWLKKEDETDEDIKLHPSLDFQRVQREQDIETLAEKINREKSLSEAIKTYDDKEKTRKKG